MDIATIWTLGTFLLVAFVLYLTPILTRPELFFGVTVLNDFRESSAARRIVRVFRLQIAVYALIAGAIVVTARSWNPGVVSAAATWFLVAGGSFAWHLGNQMAKPNAVPPASEREALLTPRDNRLPGNGILWLGPFVILGMAALYLHLHYDSLPDPYPVHWNIAGVANRFATKTPAVVFRILVIGLVVCATMAITAFSIARRGRRISISGATARQETQFRDMNLGMLLAAEYCIVSVFAWIAVAYRQPNAMPFAHYVLLAMAILPIPASVYLAVRYGQGGWRLGDPSATTLGLGAPARDPRDDGPPVGDRTPDECWKLGQIYFNPDDPAIWIEKRAGFGYTLNFARPLSWVILLATLAGPLIVVRLMRG